MKRKKIVKRKECDGMKGTTEQIEWSINRKKDKKKLLCPVLLF